ncbi:site-specific DNA-methyltransferase [Stenotrophomonas maltophilia]|uniref:site-specific DNA-methyltransferase (adenine-specific) n=1 Tax=Stenotrophomonas maltophilia TaxID=40324 RepID=A0A270NR05_STEMA|nr:site-specific DNA-methyltransferase [Stenotrophomonas maltophilia]PAM73712.1 site-specific DNA-methyltransferase [Stenotrophomonas maltophilia]
MSKQKLELTWIGKEKRPKLEPRILLEDLEKSYHAKHRVSDYDIFDNRLIFGDNLLALKALEQEFSGKVKCVFIDPPYNTGSAFAQYDDGLEHSIWLGLVRDRLEIIKRLLSDDGSLWISIDDNEAHYLKVLCDEVFGRKCFVTSFIWKKVDSPNDNKGALSPDHEYILCYVKNPDSVSFRPKQDESILNAYRQPDAESDRPYRDRLLKKNGKNSLRIDRPSMYFPIKGPDGVDVYPIHDDGQEARWAMGKKGVDELIAKGELVWKQRESGGVLRWVPYTREYAPDAPTRPWPSIWSDLHTTRQTKAHQRSVLEGVQAFETPKPEDLVSRILGISTNPGDWVLDSFAGSGTTGAAAHKMGRRWIMVELEETCHTHIIPRLTKVIDGEDKGGVTEALSWHGGGGFRYYRLAPSLIVNDRWGNLVINPEYNAAQLAEALTKLEGFTYAPSETRWWQHGHSSERDFIYVTTQNLSAEHLQALSDEVGAEQSLLVCCAAFHGVTAASAAERWPNLTLKKIPKMVLARCHWGRDDYSLNVSNLPMAEMEKAESGAPGNTAKNPKSRKAALANAGQGGLFGENE